MVQRSYSDERQPHPLGALKQIAAREPNRPYPGSRQAILYSDLRKSQVPNRKKLLIKPPLPKRVVVPETTTTQVNTQAASTENSTVAPSDQSEVSDQSDTAPVEQTAVPAEETAEPGEKVERKTEAETDDTADGIPAGQVSGGNPYANILNNKPGSPARITAFTRLPDGEHTVNGKSFTKKDNAFTLDGKVLNAREIERATRAAAEDLKRKSDTGKSAPAEQGSEQVETATASGKKSDQSDQSEKIEDYGEKIGGARKDSLIKYRKRGNQTIAEEDGEKVPAWRKKYFAMQGFNGKWDLFVEDKKLLGGARQITRSDFDSEAEALKHITEAHIANNYAFIHNGKDYSIHKRLKSVNKLVEVKSGFATREEAMKWALKNFDELIATKTGYGEKDLATAPNYKRTGEPRLNRNVTAEDLGKTFGFRGVEFGLWENQQERQKVLNDAYDALYDLAELLDIPPRALSLNGTLGVGFGSRGKGGRIRAHYEPDYVVINLTKPSGAGTFAHEWAHALDHYFKRQASGDDKSMSYLSESPGNPKEKMRKELFEAFKKIRDAITRIERPRNAEEKAELQKSIERRETEFTDKLAKLRDKLANASTKVYSRRKKSDATPEQLRRFDEIAKTLKDQPVKWQGITDKTRLKNHYRYTNDAFEKLNDLYKEITGRTGFDAKYYNVGDVAELSYILERQQNLQDQHDNKIVLPTDYKRNAKALDSNRSGGYWASDVEMFARAFSSFIEDKLKADNRVSEYLSYGSNNDFYDWTGGAKPFPEGAERTAINHAFQKFFDILETKTDPGTGNTALFSMEGDVNKKYQEKEVTVQFSDKNHSKKVDFLKNGEAIPVKKDNIHLQKGTGKSATQQVVDQIENFSPRTYQTEIGDVDIDKQSIHKSIGHGYGQEKLDVFAVLQKGFQNAVYIGNAPDWDGNDMLNHYFAFPIIYDGERKLVFCRVRSDVNKTRLYVHEIYLESDIKERAEAIQTAAEQDKTLKPHERFSPYKNILSYFYIARGDFKKTFKFFVKVNPASEKNPENFSGGVKFSMPGDGGIDAEYLSAVNRGDMKTAQKMVENAAQRAGYTIKAYHGTKEKFTVFSKGEKIGWLGKGIYFADNKKYAKTNGKNVVSAYLSIKNPYIAQANSPDGFFTEMHKKYPEANNYDIAEILQENGYDGIVYTHWDSDIGKITVVFESEQIKSADPVTYDDNGNIIPLSERFNPENKDIRFSLNTPGDTSLSPEDYRRSIDPLFDFFMEYSDNHLVNPGMSHAGEDFSGSYISGDFKGYSEKRPQGKNESDASYQRYLDRRQNALENADGTPLDELAAAQCSGGCGKLCLSHGEVVNPTDERIAELLRRLRKAKPERGRQSYATVKQTRDILAAFNAEVTEWLQNNSAKLRTVPA